MVHVQSLVWELQHAAGTAKRGKKPQLQMKIRSCMHINDICVNTPIRGTKLKNKTLFGARCVFETLFSSLRLSFLSNSIKLKNVLSSLWPSLC